MTTYQLPKPADFEITIDGKNTHLFTLKNRAGMQIALTDYGARLVSILVPDNKGNLIDVLLGFNSIHNYLNAEEKYHGATIGRVSNRIADGKFTLNGVDYQLNQNNKTNSLHGGPNGFHTKVWDRQLSFRNRIDFYYVSKEGEEGFPGEVTVNVSYELTNDNEIIISHRATTNKTTIVNLTNHAYFNLNGESKEDILNHLFQINSDKFIPINQNQIPTGDISPVERTNFDFTKAKKIDLSQIEIDLQLEYAHGFDHSFVNTKDINKPIASVTSEQTGINLEVKTDLPTIHFYSGNFLAGDKSKSNKPYKPYAGFCLEAQHFIDSPNQPKFPSIVLNPGKEYLARIIYRFNIVK